MRLGRLWKCDRGGVAPILAITVVPLIGVAGMAVDYTRASAARSAMQASLDATALMLSRSATTQSSAELEAAATDTFNALFNRPSVQNVTLATTYSSTGGSTIEMTASGTVPVDFLNVLGFSSINISASTTATWGNTRLRVALVLDNTGSMSQSGKMDALRAASQNFLTQIKEAASAPEDAYISIIPFSKDVNVGAGKVGESWLRWDLWEAANGLCSKSSYKTQASCVAKAGDWTPASRSSWNGCITDRDQNFDTTNDAPLAGGTLYPAEQYSSCPVSVMGLSNDWTALSNKIAAMQPNGTTNQAIGLQMGWQSLTAAPFSVPSLDPNFKYKQVIILLTDGLNTENRWYNNASSIDARQQKTCDNIKAAGITIYAVQVNTGGDPTSTLLQNCASDAGKFFLLTSSAQLVTTFNQIGTALSSLRLAR